MYTFHFIYYGIGPLFAESTQHLATNTAVFSMMLSEPIL